jgi:protoporphyrinogen oxidase
MNTLPTVTILGGGISGLTASATLTALGIDHTLIEVRGRTGGAAATVQQAGCRIDTGLFAFRDLPADGPQVPAFALDSGGQAFEDGAERFIEACRARSEAMVITRMAVSSIGQRGQIIDLCMENGLLLGARALIIALPARHAEHLFYGYIPELAALFGTFAYDHLYRLTLVYPKEQVPLPLPHPLDMGYAFRHWTDHPSRVPDGQILLQIGLRTCGDLPEAERAQVIAEVQRRMGLPPDPLVARLDHWPEADPLTRFDADFDATMGRIHAALPPRVVLTGSDYCREAPVQGGVVSLGTRMAHARQAALALAGML